MDLQLRGKSAIVTGGSRGIGYAIADALLNEGAHVIIAARTPHTLEAARARLAIAHGDLIQAIAVDTTDDQSVQRLIQTAEAQIGDIDILVNAAAEPAAPGSSSDLADLHDDDLRTEIETKVLGYLRTARAVAPRMIDNGWGRIINISGLAARQATTTFGSIRNVAVAAMTKNLADELGPYGINVTVVHPGMTITERTPRLIEQIARSRNITAEAARGVLTAGISIGRIVTAAEIGSVVAFLASPRSVPITGDAIPVGGGTIGPIYY